jgi:recombination DNA repair RAD52 pathway protein
MADAEAKNTSTENLYERLSEPFPVEMERTVRKSGTELVYLPVSEIINRMNRVFGPSGWSHEVMSCERNAIDPDWVVACVRVTTRAQSGENVLWTSHDGFGGVKIKRTKAGDIVDLGDEFKGAVSDALKKACQHFGVGLYLARDVEAIEIDDAMHANPDTEKDEPIVSKDATPYDKFVALRKQLNDAQVTELRSFWSEWSGGRAVPKPSEFTEEELRVLTTECVRLIFGGEYASAIEGGEDKTDE